MDCADRLQIQTAKWNNDDVLQRCASRWIRVTLGAMCDDERRAANRLIDNATTAAATTAERHFDSLLSLVRCVTVMSPRAAVVQWPYLSLPADFATLQRNQSLLDLVTPSDDDVRGMLCADLDEILITSQFKVYLRHLYELRHEYEQHGDATKIPTLHTHFGRRSAAAKDFPQLTTVARRAGALQFGISALESKFNAKNALGRSDNRRNRLSDANYEALFLMRANGARSRWRDVDQDESGTEATPQQEQDVSNNMVNVLDFDCSESETELQ